MRSRTRAKVINSSTGASTVSGLPYVMNSGRPTEGIINFEFSVYHNQIESEKTVEIFMDQYAYYGKKNNQNIEQYLGLKVDYDSIHPSYTDAQFHGLKHTENAGRRGANRGAKLEEILEKIHDGFGRNSRILFKITFRPISTSKNLLRKEGILKVFIPQHLPSKRSKSSNKKPSYPRSFYVSPSHL